MTAKIDSSAIAAFETGIVVRDVGKMMHFYRNIIGLEPYGEVTLNGIHVRALKIGNSILKLTHFANVVESGPHVGFPTGLRYMTFRVTNIEAMYKSCVACGCSVVLALEECTSLQGVTYQHAVVGDPEGNYVEFVQSMPYASPSEDFLRGRVTSA